MARDDLTIRGNHDRWVSGPDPARMGASDRYAFGQPNPDHRSWLAALPTSADANHGTLACHSAPTNDNQYLVEEVRPTDGSTHRASDFVLLRTKRKRRSLGPSSRSLDANEVIDRSETVLEIARRHVREGEERLARQIALVAKLERDNHTEPVALATKVLETIRLSLDMSKRHLSRLETRSKR